jgi:hypothetical protein
VGWVSREDAFLDEVLPLEVREAALAKKPGDTVLVQSARGWHLVKVEDVMYDLSRAIAPRSKPYGRDGAAYFAPLKELLDKDESTTLTYSVETMGCQMNSADSERIAGQLESMGMARTADPSKANVVVYNTCSIRDHAEQKVYSYIGPQAERKRKGETVAIVVAGCVAQQVELMRKLYSICMPTTPAATTLASTARACLHYLPLQHLPACLHAYMHAYIRKAKPSPFLSPDASASRE